jgi:hypothetical protein
MSRVLRGGTFWLKFKRARCADRDGIHPYYRDRGFGFRVGVFPCL